MTQTKSSIKGIIILLFTAVVWGFAFVAQNLGGDNVTPFYFNALRSLLGAVSLIPVILIFEKNANDKKIMKTTLISGSVAGVFLFIASYLQQVGINMTDSSGKAGFITGLYMILVPIVGIFIGRKTGLQTWIAAVLGVVGLFLICMAGGKITVTAGDVFLIGCAFFYTFQIITIDKFADKIYSLRFAMIQGLVCSALNFIATAIFEEFSVEPIKLAVIPILYCGIMSSGVGYTLQIIGQKFCEPTAASIVMSTESVFSVIGGAIILHERMSPEAYIGCVLIFGGILLSQITFKKKEAKV
ncbi:MAG: DMT family transporter [Ruminococcaceae bacterium]|nr:DMT family transporter [Oscillospiraceae bacterium]